MIGFSFLLEFLLAQSNDSLQIQGSAKIDYSILQEKANHLQAISCSPTRSRLRSSQYPPRSGQNLQLVHSNPYLSNTFLSKSTNKKKTRNVKDKTLYLEGLEVSSWPWGTTPDHWSCKSAMSASKWHKLMWEWSNLRTKSNKRQKCTTSTCTPPPATTTA